MNTKTDRELLEETNRDVAEIKSFFLREQVTVNDIAKELGISKRTLGRKPWLLPFYGISQYDHGVTRWDRAEWEEWKKTPTSTRRKEYEYELERTRRGL